MKSNEFIMIQNNIPLLYKAIAVLYSEDNNRSFIVYDEGHKKDNKTILKIGEILLEDEEIIIEEVHNTVEVEELWEKFKILYKNEFVRS